MTPLQNLHYAIGQIAYAIAMADGEVQKSEQEKFHGIVLNELDRHNYGFDISEIIFQILNKEHESSDVSYEWAMNQIRLNSHYLSPELKQTFILVIEKIAAAFPPVTVEEKMLIDRFRNDIRDLKGDPIYYNTNK